MWYASKPLEHLMTIFLSVISYKGVFSCLLSMLCNTIINIKMVLIFNKKKTVAYLLKRNQGKPHTGIFL